MHRAAIMRAIPGATAIAYWCGVRLLARKSRDPVFVIFHREPTSPFFEKRETLSGYITYEIYALRVWRNSMQVWHSHS
jgi:hypothetical protein